ncbi:Uncharacterised protein [Candidatus Gugararchaeum adminiculabundum]|nr:Uncharacterised protein [Candidatus Gugararchaeum adminiculabundum]
MATGNTNITGKNAKNATTAILLALTVSLLILLAGCSSPSQPSSVKNSTPSIQPNTTTGECTSETECFISAANNCDNANLTLTDNVGTFQYSASGCVLTKTLVILNANETPEMKNALEGKNMTCIYETGKFNSELVTSLLSGIEYCNGDLKEALGELVLFS